MAGNAQTKEELREEGLRLLRSSQATRGATLPLAEGLANLKPESREKLLTLPEAAQQNSEIVAPPPFQPLPTLGVDGAPVPPVVLQDILVVDVTVQHDEWTLGPQQCLYDRISRYLPEAVFQAG